MRAAGRCRRRTWRQGWRSPRCVARLPIRYLVLRMEKVAGVPRVQPTVRFPALEGIYQAYLQSGELPDAQVRRILAIERSAATFRQLKSINLLDVYTAHVKLERVIRESTGWNSEGSCAAFADWLARRLVLSAALIAAAGIQMHPYAFRSSPVAARRRGPQCRSPRRTKALRVCRRYAKGVEGAKGVKG
ncbi:hypothetical protein ACU4GD_08990 [Cupriavidus basilensis]